MKLKHFGFWIFHIFFIHSLLLTHTVPSSFQSPLFSTTYSYAHTYILSKLCLCLSSKSTFCLQVSRPTVLLLLSHSPSSFLEGSRVFYSILYNVHTYVILHTYYIHSLQYILHAHITQMHTSSSSYIIHT